MPASVVQAVHAFTLIELMVVLVVIGITTALMIPEMRGTFEHALLRGSARKVIDACDLAHSRAITRNETHRVRIDPVRSRYALEAIERGKFVPVTDAVGAQGELDRRIACELRPASEGQEAESEAAESDQERNTITFRADGTASGTDIILRDREGFVLNLRVNPITAQIEVTEIARK